MNFANPKNKFVVRQNFAKDSRFKIYTDYQTSTGTLVGPGTYNNHLTIQRVNLRPCSAKYKKMPGVNRANSGSYMMVGNQMIYEPIFLCKNEVTYKEPFQAESLTVDLHPGIPPESAKKFSSSKLKRTQIRYVANNSKTKDLVYPLLSIYGCNQSTQLSKSFSGNQHERNKINKFQTYNKRANQKNQNETVSAFKTQLVHGEHVFGRKGEKEKNLSQMKYQLEGILGGTNNSINIK